MKTPANLAEMAHEETGQWLDSDLLETWVVRRFNRLEQKIRNLESEHEAKVIQNVQLMRERDAYRNAEETQIALRERVQEQLDALLAHVHRLTKAADSLTFALVHDDKPKWKPSSATEDAFADVMDATASTPELSLVDRDMESMRKGFWWGFERARMHPDQSNILAEWEDVKGLITRNQQVMAGRIEEAHDA